MFRKRLLILGLAATGLFWNATGIQAQACIGLPQGSRGGFAFTLGFPDEAKSYGISGIGSSDGGQVFFGANFGIASYEGDDIENEKQVGGTLVYEVRSLTPGASLCPMIAAQYSWVEDLNAWSVPFGVGLGKTLPLEGGGSAITPFIIPQFLFVEVSVDDMDLSENDWFFGLSAGATFSFTNFFFGGMVSKIFEEGADAVLGVQVGLAWR
jgi:hypothetical protein